MYDDRRLWRRYPIFARVDIKISNESEETVIEGHLNSISEGGIGVYSAVPMKIGAEISMDIEFFGNEGKIENDTIEGKVAWLSKQGNIYFVGISFNETLNQDKQPKLYKHYHRVIKHD
jgi:Tfp pilus assembly protein PilZ